MNGGGLDPNGSGDVLMESFMRKHIGILVFTLLFSWPMISSAEGLGGGYSLNPPESWTVREAPGSPYKVLIGVTVNEFTPNINIQEESYSGPMDTYVELNLVAVEKMMKAKKISQEPFSAQNLDGVKLVTHTEFNGFELQQTFYFFENRPGQKVVVVATTGRNSGSQMDPVFDKIMRSFRVN